MRPENERKEPAKVISEKKAGQNCGMLCLAMKAGKLQSGEFAVEQSVKGNKARLVIIAADASDNTKKKFENMCGSRNIPYLFSFEKQELGRLLGKEERSCVSVEDDGFAGAIKKSLDQFREIQR